MEKLTDVLSMGEYGGIVLAAYMAALVILGAASIDSVRRLAKEKHALKSLADED